MIKLREYRGDIDTVEDESEALEELEEALVEVSGSLTVEREELTENERNLLKECNYDEIVKEVGYIDPKRFLFGMKVIKEYRDTLVVIGPD